MVHQGVKVREGQATGTIALQIGWGKKKGMGRREARIRWLHKSIRGKSEEILPS